MPPLLPDELLLTLTQKCPCREFQLRQLATFYNPAFASPPTLVAHGLKATGKYAAVKSVLDGRAISYATVKCIECLSVRHLLSKVLVTCAKATGQLEALEQIDRADTLNGLTVGLQKLLQNYDQRLVLVLNGIDRQRGASLTLLPALARLGDTIPNLSLIFISTSPRPLYLQKAGVPHVHFPAYTRSELLALVTTQPPSHLIPPSELFPNSIDSPTLRKLYLQFAATVYDSLIAPTASASLPGFRSTCSKLWPRFIWPYISGEQPPGKAKTWDFARLLVRNRSLFQTDGEIALIERLQPVAGAWTFEELHAAAASEDASDPSPSAFPPTNVPQSPAKPNTPLLKRFSAILLTSSYLASHTPPKIDLLLFSRLSSNSKTHRVRKNYHRRKLFQSPTATASRSSSTLDLKLGVARPFTLERLLAITRAIHPDGVQTRKSTADRVYRHLAELERLRLVVPASGGGAGASYDEEEKWRVNVGRAWVEDMASQWGVGLAEYEVGQA